MRFHPFKHGLQLAVLLASPFAADAQCNLIYQGNSATIRPGSFSDWTIQLSSFEEANVYLTGDVTAASGERILHQQSTPFPIVQGKINAVPSNCIITPQFFSREVETFCASQGILPYNNYQECVEVHEDHTGKLLARLCKDFNLQLTLPQLISPFNQEHIPPVQPVLTWLRPQNSSGFSQGIEYTLTITELLPGQSPLEALNTNPYQLQQSHLTSESFLYPPSAKELTAGKQYAWQVTAYQGAMLVGKTEVWVFTPDPLASPAKKQPLSSESFTELKRQLDAGIITSTNGVRFKVPNGDKVEPTQLTFYDDKHSIISLPELQFKATYVSNRYEIDLFPYKQFKSNHIYYLEYQSLRGEVLKMSFRYSRKKKFNS